MAFASRAAMTPIRRAYSGSPVAPTAIGQGKFVASSNRIPMPVSASSDIKSGIFAISCIAIDHDRGLVDRSTEKDDAADVVIDDLALQLFKCGAVLIEKFRVDADVDKLADLLLDRHFLELFVGPLPGLLRWPEFSAFAS